LDGSSIEVDTINLNDITVKRIDIFSNKIEIKCV
jgi:hypothetical protein